MKNRINKIFMIKFLIAIVVIFSMPQYSKAEGIDVQISDENFYNALKTSLKTSIISCNDETQTLSITESGLDTKEIDVKGKGIQDLSGIENFKKLERIDISNNRIKNIDKIPSECLKTIKLSYYEDIEDASKLAEFENLYWLTITNSELTNIPEQVTDLTRLINLTINDCKLEDISGIEKLNKLTTLDLSNNNITDISKVAALTNLRELKLVNNQISDISALKDLENISLLYFENNRISDIEAIKDKPLYAVDFKYNEIKEIKGLNFEKLTSVNFSNNNISDFSAFENQYKDSYELGSQLYKIDIDATENINLPAMVKQAMEQMGGVELETINCKVSDDYTTCTLDASTTYARIKIVGGMADDSIIIINKKGSKDTSDTIKVTKRQIIIVASIIAGIVVLEIIIIILKKKKRSK